MLIIRGAPAISWAFLVEDPINGMTAGGIFPALFGTICIVLVALFASVPVGVAAAVYLSEYAPDNWFTRIINLAIINLAGVPSIVHALFGVGAFVLFFDFGTSILAASLTLAVMTLPVVIVSTRESLQAVPPSVSGCVYVDGGHKMANHLAGGASQCTHRNSDRNHSGGVSNGRRNSAHHVHWCGILPALLAPIGLRPNHGIVAAPVCRGDPSAQRALQLALRRGLGVDQHRSDHELRVDRLPNLPSRETQVVDQRPTHVEVKDLTISYDGQARSLERQPRHPQERDFRHHRSRRKRKDLFLAGSQPDGR